MVQCTQPCKYAETREKHAIMINKKNKEKKGRKLMYMIQLGFLYDFIDYRHCKK